MNKARIFFPFLFLITALVTPAFAVTFVSDLPSFLSETSNTSTIDFEENASGDFTSHGNTAVFGGITFNGGSLFTIDPNYEQSFYDWGSGDIFHNDFRGSNITVDLTGLNITAVGFDLMSFTLDPTYGADFSISVFTSGGPEFFGSSSLERPNRQFVGFLSNEPITGLNIAVLDESA